MKAAFADAPALPLPALIVGAHSSAATGLCWRRAVFRPLWFWCGIARSGPTRWLARKLDAREMLT